MIITEEQADALHLLAGWATTQPIRPDMPRGRRAVDVLKQYERGTLYVWIDTIDGRRASYYRITSGGRITTAAGTEVPREYLAATAA